MRLILNKYFSFSLSVILISQTMVAGSTLTMIKIGDAITNSQPIIKLLIIFASLIILSHIPFTISNILLEKGKIISIRKYISKLNKSLYGKIHVLSSKKDKDLIYPWITGEAQSTIDNSLSHIHLMINLTFNFLFNMSIIVFYLNRMFLISYLIGFTAAITIVLIFKDKVGENFNECAKKRNSFRSILIKSLENHILGNELNVNLWKKQFKENIYLFEKQIIKSSLTMRMFSMITIFFCAAPIFFCIYYLCIQSSSNDLVPILITLPRQLRMIHILQEISLEIFNFKKHIMYIKRMVMSLNIEKENLNKFIKFNEIYLNGKKYENFCDILKIFDKNKRITIRGKNGVGKSCLLMELKKFFGEKAYFLPTNLNNLIFSSIHKETSSGETMLEALKKLNESKSIILLLDEWNANLDSKNTLKISKQLDKLSKTKIVVEIRH